MAVRYTVAPNPRPTGAMWHGPGNAVNAAGLARYHEANSIRGIRRAVVAGAKWIDNDYMTTRDGVIVCNHSFGVMTKEKFAAPGVPNRPIDRLTWAQVSRLRGPGGVRIQRIETMMAAYARYGIGVALELKGDGREGFRLITPANLDRIVTLANTHGVRMYIKADPAKPRLLHGLALAHQRGVWTRHNGSATFLPPAPPPKETPVVTSQNGYRANDRADVTTWTIGKGRKVALRRGDPGYLLAHFADWFDAHVEDIDAGQPDDWGYAERPIRGSTTTLSNHASGTALDLNATRHPLGKRGTFTAAQAAAIRDQLRTYDGCIRWGGDYSGRPDEMHFEINRPAADVAAVARRLRTAEDKDWFDMATKEDVKDALREVLNENDGVDNLLGPWGQRRSVIDVLQTVYNLNVPGKWRDQLRSWITKG